MKKLWFLHLVAVVWMFLAGSGAAQQNTTVQKAKVRPDLLQRVQEKGIVTVGAMLSGQWELDSKLSKDAAQLQRQAIASAQKSLTAPLVGTRYKVLWTSKTTPGISLKVGPDALVVLEGSNSCEGCLTKCC